MIESPKVALSGYRLSKAKELLKQSDLLLKSAAFDGSINRSYYAIFNGIRSLLALVSLDSQKHSGVISYFDRYFIKTGIFEKKLSQIAHNAFEVRQVSDYEDFASPTIDQAQQQLNNATSLIEEIEKIRHLFIQNIIPLPDIMNKSG